MKYYNKFHLYLFSSLSQGFSQAIAEDIKALPKRNSIIVYIPADPKATKDCLDDDKINAYHAMGFSQIWTCPIGENFDKRMIKVIKTASAIHIGGGNTFELQTMLKKTKLLKILPKLRKDTIFLGTSAGSVIMGKYIDIANIADENISGKRKIKGLNLVDFTIKPHYDPQWDSLNLFANFAKLYPNFSAVYCLTNVECLCVTPNHALVKMTK